MVKIPRPVLVAAPAMLLLAAAALFVSRQLPAAATAGSAGMSLLPAGPSVSCDAPEDPATCTVGGGDEFHLSIGVDSLPEGASGYIGFQTLLFYDGLTYKPAADAADEFVWPDSALPLRSPASPDGTEGTVAHGDVTAQTPPLEPSSYLGNIVQVELTCSDVAGSFQVALLAYDPATRPLGAGFRLGGDDGDATVAAKASGQAVLDLDGDPATGAETVEVAGLVQINCSGPTPTPVPDLPDLAVQSMSITLETGGACNYTSTNLGIRIFVANIGTQDAGPFAVDVNGARQTVDGGLEEGGKTSLWFPGYNNGENSASVDALGQVAELNEANNGVTPVLPVPTLPAPCTPTPTPTLTPTPPGLPGDVDCSGSVTAIDAALILQFIAALTDSLPCEQLADANGSATLDAIDATLVLQFVAGLLGALGAKGVMT